VSFQITLEEIGRKKSQIRNGNLKWKQES